MKKNKSRLNLWFRGVVIVGVIRLSAILPLSWSQGIGRALASLLILIKDQNYITALRNTELCLPELDEQQRRSFAKQSIKHLGMTVMEAGVSWVWTPEQIRAVIHETIGLDLFDRYKRENRPVILVMPHIGNWELLPVAVPITHPVVALYRPSEQPGMDHYVKDSRERLNMEMAPANHSGVKTLLTRLREGKTLLVLADHEPSRGNGVFVPFFGVTAYTGVLVPKLAAKVNAAIVMAAVERLPNGTGYRAHFYQGPDIAQEQDVGMAATQLNVAIAELVMKFPEQFTWNYKRFRTQPPGQKSPYRKKKK